MLAGSAGGPCRVPSRSSPLGLKGGLGFSRLFSRPLAFDGCRRASNVVTGLLIWTGWVSNDSLTDVGLKGGLEFNRLSGRPFAPKWALRENVLLVRAGIACFRNGVKL